jgi:hypothetical protein
MADYYPLIAKAVAGLPSSTPETRSAIYQRARNALLGQLRRLEPPIPESDVARESASLEVAIARLEAELAPPEVGARLEPPLEPLVEAPVEARAPEPERGDANWPVDEAAPAPPAPIEVEAQPETIEAPPSSSEAPAPPVAEEPPEQAPEAATAPPEAEASAIQAAAEEAEATHAAARPQPAPPPAFFKLRRDKPALFTPPATSRPPNSPPATSSPPRQEGFLGRRAPGSAPTFRSPLFPPPPGSAPVAPLPAASDSAPPLQESAGQESPSQEPGAGEGLPEGSGANAASDFEPVTPPDVAPEGVAGEPGAEESAALRRISPALAKPRPEAQRPFAPQPTRDDAAPRRLWIVGFVVGLLVFLVAIAAFQLRDRPEDLRQKAAAPVIAPETGSNGKIVDRIGVGSDGTQSAPASSSADNATAQDAAAAKSAAGEGDAMPSGGRAALLVEAPGEASKVRTYLGSVVWKVDNVSNGPGDPLSMAVRAEIDIPEQKLQTAMTLQKNFDGGLPASHTMKIQFNEGADSPLGAIQQISVPQMRREDTATGDGLSGIPVAITDNSFLVGLSRGNAEASNLDLLTSREWIDVPMLLSNGKIAKLTFEKGQTGNRAIADALAAWKAQ